MKKNSHWLNPDRTTQLLLFILLAACFTYTFPRWADPNTNSHLDMIVAVVEDHTFQIDPYVANTVDYAQVGSHYYSDKAPGFSFLGIPVYAGLKTVLDTPVLDRLMTRLENNKAFTATLRENGSGILKQKVRIAIAQVVLTFLLVVLPTALLGILLYRLLGRFTSKHVLRAGLVLAFGLLTPAFAYAGSFYSHMFTAALLFGAFYIVFMSKRPLGVVPLLTVGLLLGYSVASEYPTILIAGIIYLYTLYTLYRQGSWLKIGWVTLFPVLVALGLMVYNKAIFGSPFNLGYDFSTQWTVQHHTGFMSLTYPHLDAIWGITFGLFRGLFILSPWLLFAIPGFYLWWRSKEYRPEFWVALTGVLAFFAFDSSSVMWWGGFAIGPRYLYPMLPFMVLPSVFVFRRWGMKSSFKVLTILLMVWSFIATWGLTLAEQAFPSDTIYNPLLEYALPNWRAGDIARNWGTVLGLPGIWSLLPLFCLAAILFLVWWITSGYPISLSRIFPQPVPFSSEGEAASPSSSFRGGQE